MGSSLMWTCKYVYEEPYMSSKEPYMSSKEPYMSSKEPYMSSKEPLKEPYIFESS